MTATKARLWLALGFAFGSAHCGKGTSAGSGATGSPGVGDMPGASTAPAEPMTPHEAEAWARAKDGEDDDRVRLVDLVGCTGLRERSSDTALRIAAVRAMAFCSDFSELPWLAGIGADARDEAGLEALSSAVSQAARPRRATDPEDAADLGQGCRALLELSRMASAPRPRRIAAVNALRMLVDWGCVKQSEIPTDI